VDGDRIGLVINDEDIYVTTDELQAVGITNAECIVKSEVMELYIVL
jgi:sulfur relay (sulfurtransferase) DsrF/TusC family protein